MFGDEYAVEISLRDGRIVSFFADSSLVQTNGTQESGYVRVSVIEDNGSVSKVLLPSEAFESGTRWAEIPLGQLEPA